MPFLLRLPDALEEALDFYSKSTGKSKNSIGVEAIRRLLEDEYPEDVPLQEKVIESKLDRMLQDREKNNERYREATVVMDWIMQGLIWTAKTDLTGDQTGALYGRNIIESFVLPENEPTELWLVVKHFASTPARGASQYSRELFLYEKWVELMQVVRPEFSR